MDIQENLQKTDTIIADVYWIRKPEHTDINTEGYVGIATDTKKRWQQHKTSAKKNKHPKSLLEQAINSYQDTLLYEVIFTGPIEECYKLQQQLRPLPNTGWNIHKGGSVGKITNEGRKQLSESAKGPWSLSRKWRAYRKRTGVKITLTEYEELIVNQNFTNHKDIEEALLHYRLVTKYKDYKVVNVLSVEELQFKDFAANMPYDALVACITSKENTWELIAP